MAREVTKKYKLGRSIQGGGYSWRLTGEGSPTEGDSNQLRLLNDTNAPIGSEYIDLITGVKYVKIDTTPNDAGAYKVGGWATTSDQSISSSGIEFTGGFAGKPASNQYAWQNGVGINISQSDVDAERFKTFSFDSTIQAAVDTPYWSDPTPEEHTGKGVFGGSYLPEGVTSVFDYTTVDSDTYEDGSNIVTTGGLDFSQLKVGDKVEVRFDFNCIPQIANTTIEPAIWYKNRDANDNVTFTFPLTSQPIFYGTGTVGKTYLNRVSLTIYIASQEDINSLSHFAIKSDNIVIIQPLTTLFTLIR
jgi:hypothetical protein